MNKLQKAFLIFKEEGFIKLIKKVYKLFIKKKIFYLVFFLRILNFYYLKLLNKSNIPYGSEISYQIWLLNNYPNKKILLNYKNQQNDFVFKPLISIILPVYNTPEKFLEECLDSVINQVYENWELCIADDKSSEEYIKTILNKYSQKDKRIKVIYREINGNICEASNSALSLAIGDYIGLMDHDDILSPDCLFEIVNLLNKNPEAEIIYSDEGLIDKENRVTGLFFKADWSPESLLSRNYINHFTVYKKEIINKIGGFRSGFEDSQDYDLILRVTELTNNIFHISKILYYWRIYNSFSGKFSEKCKNNAKKALEEALERRNEKGYIIPTNTNHQIVRFEIKEYKKISIIIPTRDFSDVLAKCLDSIFTKSTYPNYEIIIIDNGSTEQKTFDLFDYWTKKEPERIKIYKYNIDFNYPKLNNYAVSKSTGEFLLFLNNDTEVITNDWLEAMVEYCQKEYIGAVGALLLYPDNTVQHAGVIAISKNNGGNLAHGHKNFNKIDAGYFGALQTVNNYSAVTAACLMCRKEVFEKINGFEEELAVAFNDVDFCFKLLKNNFRNVYLPHVQLYHHESKSRGYETTPEKKKRFQQEIKYMQNKWENIIKNDPYYNPNLSQVSGDFSVNIH